MVKLVKNFKVFIIAVSVIFCSYACDAQGKNNKNKIRFGLTFSTIAYLDVVQFSLEDGDPRYSGLFYYSSGIDFQYSLSGSLKVNTSIVFGSYKIRITPYSPVYEIFTDKIYLFYVPITLQKNFSKHFFTNGGILIDFELNKRNQFDRQNGIGGTYGLGLEFYPDSKISFILNPYINIHSIIPFTAEILNERLLETGLKLGFMF